MSTYFCILTAIGEAKLANATALGQTLEFSQMALGDGGGSMPTPSQSQEALVNEVRRAPLNTVAIDKDNPNWIVCEQIVPADVGGWTIRELGIIDADGDLVAVGNFPETYKPVLAEGSGRTQTVRMVLQVSNAATVTLKIDPSVVLATREYVDQSSDEHLAEAKEYSDQKDMVHSEAEDPHVQYLKKAENTEQLNALKQIPIYPEVMTDDNRLSIALDGANLSVDDGQVIRMFGWLDVNTSSYQDKSFVLDLSKTYHLRFDLDNGFRLLDLEDLVYNPDQLDHFDKLFDATYSDVLVALLEVGEVTSYINVNTVPNGEFERIESVSSYSLSGTSDLLELNSKNEFSRAIRVCLSSEIFVSGPSETSGYGHVKWLVDNEVVFSSKRYHVGTSGGYIYIDSVVSRKEFDMNRKEYSIKSVSVVMGGTPYFNVNWWVGTWSHLTCSSYVSLGVV